MTDEQPTLPSEPIDSTGKPIFSEPTPDVPPTEGPAPKTTRRRRSSSADAGDAGASKTKPRRRPGRPSNHDERSRKITGLHEQIATALTFAGVISPRCFTIADSLTRDAGKIGEAWATWADTSPRVASLIDNAAVAGGAGGVMVAYVGVIRAAFATPPAGATVENLDPDNPPPAGLLDLLSMFPPAPDVDPPGNATD